MELTMLKGKIHRAVVKQAELNYVRKYHSRSGINGSSRNL